MVADMAQIPAQTLSDSVGFVSLIRSPEASQRLRLLIHSQRAYGGPFSRSPFWVFWDPAYHPAALVEATNGWENISFIPLQHADGLPDYPFVHKIAACAQAEELTAGHLRSLVWLDPNCLVVQPPTLFNLYPDYAAAFRPVHIRNVGSLAGEPLDDFWGTIYRIIGLESAPYTIHSFGDDQELRPYFNTHLFSIDPAEGILRRWLETFRILITDQPFQAVACRSELHRIFLHQAIFSTLAARLIPLEHLRILPPEYSYPLHLHSRLPQTIRATSLNDLVCAVYEDDPPHPQTIQDLPVREPLNSWLMDQLDSA